MADNVIDSLLIGVDNMLLKHKISMCELLLDLLDPGTSHRLTYNVTSSSSSIFDAFACDFISYESTITSATNVAMGAYEEELDVDVFPRVLGLSIAVQTETNGNAIDSSSVHAK